VKSILDKFDKLLENRVRLAVMSMLMIHEVVDFNTIKQALSVTDGNLASHMSMLEKNRYITVKKQFKGRKPLTTYTATQKGRKAFAQHLDALELIIKSNQQ